MEAYSPETLKEHPLRSLEGSNEIIRQYRKLMDAFNTVFSSYPNLRNFKTLHVYDKFSEEMDIELFWNEINLNQDAFEYIWKNYYNMLSKFMPEQLDEGVSFQTLFTRIINEPLQPHLVSFQSMIRMAAIAINAHSLFNFLFDLSHTGNDYNGDFHGFAESGANYLGLQWKDIYHTLQERVDAWVLRKWRAARSYKAMLDLYPQRLMTELEERGIQMANYAYDGKEVKNRYMPTVVQPYVNAGYPYDPQYKALFKLGYGLRGTLFTVQSPSPIEDTPEDTLYLMFSGTKKNSPSNWRTDIRQYIQSDPVYYAALGFTRYINNCRKHDNMSHMVIGGHSLGGGLAQFSLGALLPDGSLQGIGYNSAGLSNYNLLYMKNPATKQFVHVFVKNDMVHKFGSHIGECLVMPRVGFWAHGTECLRKYIGERYYCEYKK